MGEVKIIGKEKQMVHMVYIEKVGMGCVGREWEKMG